jgi:hypothetical protein
MVSGLSSAVRESLRLRRDASSSNQLGSDLEKQNYIMKFLIFIITTFGKRKKI